MVLGFIPCAWAVEMVQRVRTLSIVIRYIVYLYSDGLIGMAIVGGAAMFGGAAVLAVGGLVGLGLALRKK